MSPKRWITYSASSLRYVHDENKPDWLDMHLIEDEFKSKKDYIVFLEEYQEQKDMYKAIKHLLADK